MDQVIKSWPNSTDAETPRKGWIPTAMQSIEKIFKMILWIIKYVVQISPKSRLNAREFDPFTFKIDNHFPAKKREIQ